LGSTEATLVLYTSAHSGPTSDRAHVQTRLQMRLLNVDVGWTEHMWQRVLLKGLDQELFFRFGNVKKPTDDDDFEDLLLEVGHSL